MRTKAICLVYAELIDLSHFSSIATNVKYFSNTINLQILHKY